MSKMKIGDTTHEYCQVHGYQEFFLGRDFISQYDYLEEESLHCPICYSDHPDNPAVVEREERHNSTECASVMHL